MPIRPQIENSLRFREAKLNKMRIVRNMLIVRGTIEETPTSDSMRFVDR